MKDGVRSAYVGGRGAPIVRFQTAVLLLSVAAFMVAGRVAHPAGQNMMKFHAGQMYAHAGEPLYSIAARRMEQSTQDSSPSWQAYVSATVAFLKRDLSELKWQRGALAALPGSPGNTLNLAVVDRLIAFFEEAYAEAYRPKVIRPYPLPNNLLERARDD